MAGRTFPQVPDVPDEIRTPRLLLRAPRLEDAEALQDAVTVSLPELRQWMPWAHEEMDLAGRRAYIERSLAAFTERRELTYLVWSADGQTLLGNSSFHHVNWAVPKAEIGYWMATPHTGQGYAREAAQALTEFGLTTLGLRRLEIRCDAQNERSARIPQALGYMLDARLINDDVAAHDPTLLRDTLIFSRVR